MAGLQWRKEFETGVPGVDFEHRNLVRVIDLLIAKVETVAPAGEVRQLLGEVHMLIESHFALEERLMRDTGYDEYPAHKADHDRLLEDIRDIMDDAEQGARPGPELSTRVTEWFGGHFRTHDARLHRAGGG